MDLADLIDKSPSDATITVKVKEMRAALWYYHNYWIMLAEREEKNKLLDHYERIVDDDAETIKTQTETIDGYKIAVPILIAVTIASTILYISEVIQ